MAQVHKRQYGVETTINFELIEVDGINFRTDAAHAAGDTFISKDEGAEASTTNGFTDEGTGYSIVLTATEMQAARIALYLVDQTGTKVWLDREIIIETEGSFSAQHNLNHTDAILPDGAVPSLGIIEGGTAQAAAATTLTIRAAATNDSISQGSTIFAGGSTQGYWQSVLVDSVSGDVLTHGGWPITTPTGTITYLVFGTPTGSTANPIPSSVSDIGAAALAKFFSQDSGTTYASAVAGSVVKEVSDNAAGSGLDAAQTRAALGMASADLDTQLDALPTAAENRAEMDSNSTQLAAIVADTNELQADDVPGLIAALNDITASDVLTTQMTEAYAANGVAPTLAQALFAVHQSLMHFGISGTAKTVKQLDNTTTAFVETLDDAADPTAVSRT